MSAGSVTPLLIRDWLEQRSVVDTPALATHPGLQASAGTPDPQLPDIVLAATVFSFPNERTAERQITAALSRSWAEIIRRLATDSGFGRTVESRGLAEALAGALRQNGWAGVGTHNYGSDWEVGCGRLRSGRLSINTKVSLRTGQHLGVDEVVDMIALYFGHYPTKAMIMTTGEFAPDVFTNPRLQSNDLQLLDGPQVREWLRRHLAGGSQL